MLRHRRKTKTQRDKIYDIVAQHPKGIKVAIIIKKLQTSGDPSIASMVTGALRRCLQELLSRNLVYKKASTEYDFYGRNIPIWYPV